MGGSQFIIMTNQHLFVCTNKVMKCIPFHISSTFHNTSKALCDESKAVMEGNRIRRNSEWSRFEKYNPPTKCKSNAWVSLTDVWDSLGNSIPPSLPTWFLHAMHTKHIYRPVPHLYFFLSPSLRDHVCSSVLNLYFFSWCCCSEM